MEDSISRQEAIDILDAYQVMIENGEENPYSWARLRMSELSSAQPEPCDDPRADVYYLAEKIGIHRLYALVVELRGEPDPCEDAVSREAVSEWLKQYGQDVLHGKYKFSLMYIWKNLTDLPSVQIKRKNGEWIYNSPVTMKCNQCGFVIKDWDWHRFKICPNCGADMRGEQE